MRRRPVGRPPKPVEEHHVRAPMTLPPEVWEQFKELVPARERSAVIANLLRKEIRRRRQAARDAIQGKVSEGD